jgi:hypothetical protein
MALRNSRKSFIFVVGVKGYFPGYLLDLCMQNPSVKGLRGVSNHCTIAYITVLLDALTAAKTGNKDKICFVKSFLPNI